MSDFEKVLLYEEAIKQATQELAIIKPTMTEYTYQKALEQLTKKYYKEWLEGYGVN